MDNSRPISGQLRSASANDNMASLLHSAARHGGSSHHTRSARHKDICPSGPSALPPTLPPTTTDTHFGQSFGPSGNSSHAKNASSLNGGRQSSSSSGSNNVQKISALPPLPPTANLCCSPRLAIHSSVCADGASPCHSGRISTKTKANSASPNDVHTAPVASPVPLPPTVNQINFALHRHCCPARMSTEGRRRFKTGKKTSPADEIWIRDRNCSPNSSLEPLPSTSRPSSPPLILCCATTFPTTISNKKLRVSDSLKPENHVRWVIFAKELLGHSEMAQLDSKLFCESVSNILDPIVTENNQSRLDADEDLTNFQIESIRGLSHIDEDQEVDVNAAVDLDNHNCASKCGVTGHFGAGPGPDPACGLVAAHALHLTHPSSLSCAGSIGGSLIDHHLEKGGDANEPFGHGTGRSTATNDCSAFTRSPNASSIGKVIPPQKQLVDDDYSSSGGSSNGDSDVEYVGSQASNNPAEMSIVTAESK